ncbi:ABC transporter ATP-binding protein [bacterium]|nr:ABC transporter ATP-binding protein [bacterium]
MNLNAIDTLSETMVNRTTEPYVQLHDVAHTYRIPACDKPPFTFGPVTLAIKKGEIIVVIGQSGSGKTTLLRLISGLERTSFGMCRVNGSVLFDKNSFIPPEKRKIGMVFQDHALFPHLTVKKNILFGIKKMDKKFQTNRLHELTDMLGIQNFLNRYPYELSGGQQQRVALARSLAPNPKILLLDEPLSNIDAELRNNLAQELKSIIQQTKTTAVWVTHDLNEALDTADRVLVMNNGIIEQFDTPWDLYRHPKTKFIAAFIGNASFLQGHVSGNHIVTEIGTLPCPMQYRQIPVLEVMVKPCDLSVQQHTAGIGVLIKKQFLGSTFRYTISLPSKQTVLSDMPPECNWELNTRVAVNLCISEAVVFPTVP